MKSAWVSLVLVLVSTAAQAGPLPTMPPPSPLDASHYTWQQTGITPYGLQADGLVRYGFDFNFTNTGTTALTNVYDIIPPDPAVSFGLHDGVWNSMLREWTAMTAHGLAVAKPYNIAGFLDAATPQYPVFAVTPYLAPGQSTNVELQFEFSKNVGYFTFEGYLTAVPEPASALLLAGGTFWLAARRRRKTTVA